MKVRNGFVSNSSSSSFCIWGIQLHDDIQNVKGFEDIDPDKGDLEQDIYEKMDTPEIKKLGYSNYGYGSVYFANEVAMYYGYENGLVIGMNFDDSKIYDSMTFGEMREDAADRINKFLHKPTTPDKIRVLYDEYGNG
jgi:hypothetical protein